MKGKKRKGASLPMVIIAMIIIVAMLAIMASVIDTANTQTVRMTQYLKAKYVATSGTQLALGAYHGKKGEPPTLLYTEFQQRANSRGRVNYPIVEATPEFKSGKAEVTMSGAFSNDSSGNPSTSSADYEITISSKAQIGNSNDYYVHTVVFNWDTNGIRSEKGGVQHSKTLNK